jgi:hypothetical protein
MIPPFLVSNNFSMFLGLERSQKDERSEGSADDDCNTGSDAPRKVESLNPKPSGPISTEVPEKRNTTMSIV